MIIVYRYCLVILFTQKKEMEYLKTKLENISGSRGDGIVLLV